MLEDVIEVDIDVRLDALDRRVPAQAHQPAIGRRADLERGRSEPVGQRIGDSCGTWLREGWSAHRGQSRPGHEPGATAELAT